MERRGQRGWKEQKKKLDRETEANSKQQQDDKTKAETADALQQTRETVNAKVSSLEHLIKQRSSSAKPTHETKRKTLSTRA